MSGASSLAFPGSRNLAGWWGQLAPIRPQSLWVAHLLLHHVEARVRLAGLCRPDVLTSFLLKALALEESGFVQERALPRHWLDRLDDRLHVGRQFLQQALRGVQGEGLARPDATGRWELTSLGRQALQEKEYRWPREERRTFYFLAAPPTSGGPGRPPPFLDLHNSTGIPWPEAAGEEFDPRLLQACIEQPPEWKQRHGFPLEIEEVVGLASDAGVSPIRAPSSSAFPGTPLAWQNVIVDRAERVLAVLVLAPGSGGAPQLLGFAVRPEGWVLQMETPLFTLGPAWGETFPGLTEELDVPSWQRAWRSWCEANHLAADLVDACLLERVEERLRVSAPARLLGKARAARGEPPQGEIWLLAGEGPIRPAARVELVERSPPISPDA